MPTTVGPVTITASGGTVSILGPNTAVVTGTAQIVNNTAQPAILTLQQSMPDGTPLPEGTMTSEVLQAKGSTSLPAAGESWLVTAISERHAARLMEDVNLVGWVVLALAGYGGFRLWQDHKHRLGIRGY